MHVHTIVHNCRTQQRAQPVMIIFSLIIQTIIIAQMMSVGEEEVVSRLT